MIHIHLHILLTTTDVRDLLTRLFDKQVQLLLTARATHAELIAVTDFHAIRSLTKLFDAFCTIENGVDPADEPVLHLRVLELYFLCALVWSVGASV